MKKVMKNIVAIMLVVVMTIGVAPLEGFVGFELPNWINFSNLFEFEAEAATEHYESGGFKYTLDDSNYATIIDCDPSVPGNTSSIFVYNVTVPSVIDGYTVIAIGKYAFSGYTNLKSISLPNTLIEIADYAFQSCTSLPAITIPESVIVIGNNAFFNCNKFTDIYIPKNVENIGNNSFSWCSNLRKITVDSDNLYYSSDDYGVLFDKTKKEIIAYPPGGANKYVIPGSVKTIGEDAFYCCENLNSISIPESVISIEDSAFYSCKKLVNVNIPCSVTNIGRLAFSFCENLSKITVDSNNNSYASDEFGVLFNKNLTLLIQYPSANSRSTYNVPESVKYIGEFSFCGSIYLSDVSISDSVQKIERGAFYQCEKLVNVTLGRGITRIENDTFAFCDLLGSIIIPNGVKSIGECAFCGSGLKNIIIPVSLKSIEYGAFASCSSLENIYYVGTESQWKSLSVDYYNDDLINANIHYTYSVKTFPSGYNFDEDRYNFRNYNDTVEVEYYQDVYGDYKGPKIYSKYEKNADGKIEEGGMCYGMAASTGAILKNAPEVNSFVGLLGECESISEITKKSICFDLNTISAETFIKYAHITQFSTQAKDTILDCNALYNAVYDYVYNNGAPVLVSFNEAIYSAETKSLSQQTHGHTVLAVGLDGYNILVDDPSEETIQTVYLTVDENGDFTDAWRYPTNTWSYGMDYGDRPLEDQEKICWISYNKATLLPYMVEKANAKLDYNGTLPDDEAARCYFELIDTDYNLVVSPDDNSLVGSELELVSIGYPSSGNDIVSQMESSGLYWVKNGATVSFSNITKNDSECSLVGNNEYITVMATEGDEILLGLQENGFSADLTVSRGDSCKVEFAEKDSDGKEVKIIISGIASGDEVHIFSEDETIKTSGLNDIKVQLVVEDEAIDECDVSTENDENIEFTFDNDSITSNVYEIVWKIDENEIKNIVVGGSAITAPETPEKTGYTFTGWTPEIPEIMPAEDLTFTATWSANSYNAVFDANGGAWSDGSEEKAVATAFGSQIIAPDAPSKQGYIFSGWSAEVGVMDDINGKMFVAEWIPATDTIYTVETYLMNTFGEYEKTVNVYRGTTGQTVVTENSAPEGFVVNERNSVLTGTIAADNSLVLKVYIDRNAYTFTTVVDGVSTSVEYLYDSMISEPAIPTKAGYKFMGWDKEIPETMPAKNITVTAEFETAYICPDCGDEILGEDAINAHKETESRMKATVKIRSNTGSNTINYGETLELTAIATDKPADTYIVWYVDGAKAGEGEKFSISLENGTKTVEVKLVDASGNVLKDSNGNEIKDAEKVSVNSGIWQKIVSFFKNLFKINRTVIQSFFKTF